MMMRLTRVVAKKQQYNSISLCNRRNINQQLVITSSFQQYATEKTYAGLTKQQVEARLREQGIVPSASDGKKKVKMSKWVNPILNKPLETELKKPDILGTDFQRKMDMAIKILARPFFEEQKTEEYRQNFFVKKSSDLKTIEDNIQQIQQLKQKKLKEKKAFSSDRDTSIFVGIYPSKLLPNNAEEAILFQKKLISHLLENGEKQKADPEFSQKYKYPIALKGWKVGATQPKVQSTLGLEKPFLGPIFEHQVFTQVSESERINLKNTLIGQLMPRAECEFVFVLKKELPARSENQEPYTREQVAECIGEVIPAMELVGSRIEDVGDVSKEFFLRMADCGSHIALLLSDKSIRDPTFEDLDNLWMSQVEFNMNEDEEIINGRGNNVYNGQVHKSSNVGPLDTTTWAINEITAPESQGGRGLSVSAGTLISSGTMTGKSRQIDHGDRLVASFTDVPTFQNRTVHVSVEF